MKVFKKLGVALTLGVIGIFGLASCGNNEESEPIDYSKLTFEEVFEVEQVVFDWLGGEQMPGLTMNQLTSSTVEGAYQIIDAPIFNLKTKYDVEVTGIKFKYRAIEVAPQFIIRIADGAKPTTEYFYKSEKFDEPQTDIIINETFDSVKRASGKTLRIDVGAGNGLNLGYQNIPGQIYDLKLIFTVTQK